jgi:outer membrane receptor protein involved in Fe transport
MLETPVFGRLSATGGLRTEVMTQKVESTSPFPAEMAPVLKTDRTDVDYLPGVALKYELSQKMLLRAAYGMTVSRPLIRELAPYQYYDFVRDRNIEGNPELKRTLIHNADLRWEWFFGEGQILAASAFYKRFKDPIEVAILDPTNGSSQFRNVTRAQNLGTELEARLNLGRLSRALRRFDLDSNLSLVRSRLDIPPDLARIVRASRPLAGQSPYVANLSLRFFDEHRGVTAALVYNVVGPRIADVATRVRVGDMDVIPPDIEEQAFQSLDFVASAELGRHLQLKAKVRNILKQSKELKQGDFSILRIDPGISASLGLTVAY